MLRVADVPQARQLIAFLAVLPTALAVGLADDGAVAALRTADPAGGEHEVDGAERVLHAVGVMLDAARVEEKARPGGAPHLGGLLDRAPGHAGDFRGPGERPLAAVVRDLFESDGVLGDEGVIDPVALDHDLQHTGEQRGIAARLDRQVQIAGPRHRRDARILDDDAGALLARLPDVVGRDRRTLGDIRAGHPDHLGPHHVRPRIRRAVDAEGLLVRRTGADHAQAAVVVDERRLQAHPRELAEQVRLLRREARAAEHRDRAGSVGLLKVGDPGGHLGDRGPVRHVGETRGRRRIAAQEPTAADPDGSLAGSASHPSDTACRG